MIGELARTIYGMTKAKDSASLSYTEKHFPACLRVPVATPACLTS